MRALFGLILATVLVSPSLAGDYTAVVKIRAANSPISVIEQDYTIHHVDPKNVVLTPTHVMVYGDLDGYVFLAKDVLWFKLIKEAR